MAAAEKMVRMAADLYAIRDQMRRLFGAKYHEIIGGYAKSIRHVANERKIDTLAAAIQMSKEAKAMFWDPIIPICLLAAAVEIAEPSSDQPSGDA